MDRIIEAVFEEPRFVPQPHSLIVHRERSIELEFLLSNFGVKKNIRYEFESRVAKKMAGFYKNIHDIVAERWFDLNYPDGNSALTQAKIRLQGRIDEIIGHDGGLEVKTRAEAEKVKELRTKLDALEYKKSEIEMWIEPKIVDSAWPLNIFECKYGDYQRGRILNPNRVIIHIENSVFALFYMSHCHKLIFKNKVKDNKSYHRRHEDRNQPVPMVFRSISTVQEASDFVDEEEAENATVLRARALARFRKHRKGLRIGAYEWITNYDFGKAKCLETGPHFELLLVVASQLGKMRTAAVLRAISFLLIMNSRYDPPMIKILPRSNGSVNKTKTSETSGKRRKLSKPQIESRLNRKIREYNEKQSF